MKIRYFKSADQKSEKKSLFRFPKQEKCTSTEIFKKILSFHKIICSTKYLIFISAHLLNLHNLWASLILAGLNDPRILINNFTRERERKEEGREGWYGREEEKPTISR